MPWIELLLAACTGVLPFGLRSAVGHRQVDAARPVRDFLDDLVTPVIVLDGLGAVSRLNSAAAALTGDPEGVYLGRHWSALLARLGLDLQLGPLLEAAGAPRPPGSEPGPDHAVAEVRLLDGSRRVFLWTVTYAGPPHPAHMLLQGTELRSRALAPAGEGTAPGQLLRALEAAHELKSPLTTILAGAERLAAELAESPAAADADRLAAEAQRARRICNDLLSESAGAAAVREPVDMNHIVGEAAYLVSGDYGAAGVDLCILPASEAALVSGDKGQLLQVLLNLLTNARDAMESGGRVEMAVCGGAATVLLSVTDNGTGLPAHLMDRAFDAFVSTKSADRGTGLGLTISKGIVELHGGTLTVRNRMEGGAVFTVTLPTLVAERPAPVVAPPLALIADTPTDCTGVARLLVVDDEEPLRMMFTEILSDSGYRVQAAADAEEALDLVLAGEFDLVISDIRLPGMTGAELYDRVCEARPDLAGSFIFSSGDSGTSFLQEFTRRTGNRCLEKPFSLAQLLDTVREALPATGHATS